MRHHTIEVNERELRVILTAFDIARDETINRTGWRWWFNTQYALRLYERLRDHGLDTPREKGDAGGGGGRGIPHLVGRASEVVAAIGGGGGSGAISGGITRPPTPTDADMARAMFHAAVEYLFYEDGYSIVQIERDLFALSLDQLRDDELREGSDA